MTCGAKTAEAVGGRLNLRPIGGDQQIEPFLRADRGQFESDARRGARHNCEWFTHTSLRPAHRLAARGHDRNVVRACSRTRSQTITATLSGYRVRISPRKHPCDRRSRRRHGLLLFVGMRRVGGALIDAALGQSGELLVGGLFLVERLLQEPRRLGVSHRLRPRDQRAVGRHLVVLGALPGGNQARIHRRRHRSLRP